MKNFLKKVFRVVTYPVRLVWKLICMPATVAVATYTMFTTTPQAANASPAHIATTISSETTVFKHDPIKTGDVIPELIPEWVSPDAVAFIYDSVPETAVINGEVTVKGERYVHIVDVDGTSYIYNPTEATISRFVQKTLDTATLEYLKMCQDITETVSQVDNHHCRRMAAVITDVRQILLDAGDSKNHLITNLTDVLVHVHTAINECETSKKVKSLASNLERIVNRIRENDVAVAA